MGPVLTLFIISDHTWEFLIEQQPIGSKLFEMFCSKKEELSRCFEFLNEVKDYEIHVLPTKRQSRALTIYDQFLSVDVSNCIVTIVEPLLWLPFLVCYY